MGVYIWSRLPSEYQEVEWIGGNNGNSSSPIVYINTGVASSNNIGCHTEMLHTGTRDNLRFFDNDLLSTTNRWGLVAYPSGNWCPQWGTRIQTNVSYNINQFYDIKLNRNNNKLCTIDGTTIYNCSSASFTGPSIKIGQITYSGNYGWKLKYFKITDGTTLIRDLVPCYRKSDNVIGMYDLVNNQFYTNSGSGTFSKGNDVTMVEMKNAYIGEVTYFDFSSDNLHGYTNYIMSSPGLTIDTVNQRCIPGANTVSNCIGDIGKDGTVANSLHMRVKGKFLSLPSGSYTANGFWCGTQSDNTKSIAASLEWTGSSKVFKLVGPNFANRGSVTPSFSVNTYYYIDIFYSNGVVTAKLMDVNMNVLNTLTHNVTQSNWRKGFGAYTQKNSSQTVEIKEFLEETN